VERVEDRSGEQRNDKENGDWENPRVEDELCRGHSPNEWDWQLYVCLNLEIFSTQNAESMFKISVNDSIVNDY
jgi:hypothetical protein